LTYSIGIDVGTSYTAAAVSRSDGGVFADPEPVVLGARSMATASVVFVGDDGRLLVGDAAERRALSQPERVIREFKRRLGDSVPLIVGEWSHQPEDLAAIMVKWVVDRVADREGGPAAAVGVTHPASWGPYKLALFRQALAHLGLQDVTLLSEPVAAAAHYASHARIEPGSTVAVYDLGGGTFDAAVVRKTDEHTFELRGRPEGIERLGGVDFDEAVFAHLKTGADLPPLDMANPDTLAALARLRRECTDAKEALSADTETTIPVLLPQKQTRVRLVRAEFEGMVRDALQETIAALRQTIASAGVADDELNSLLLVGGSSRIPLVAQLISAEFARPVAIDADPKATIALGAARAAAATAPVVVGDTTNEADASGGEDVPVSPTKADGADSADSPDAQVHHPYEQLLQLRSGGQQEASSSPFGRVPAAAVAALIAIVISAAAALAWTSTVDSPGPFVREAQAVEESPSAETTTAAPPEDKLSTSGVSSTEGRTADSPPVAEADDPPLKATKATQGVLGGRDSSPAPSKKASSSPTPSAAGTSQTPSPTTSTSASPTPSPTSSTPTPSPTPSTSSPPPPPPPPPPPDPTTEPPTSPPPSTTPPPTSPPPSPTGTGEPTGPGV
jgi:molecular chaperone DnaK